MDRRLSGDSIDIVQALVVFIYLCLHIIVASTSHHQPFDHKMCIGLLP